MDFRETYPKLRRTARWLLAGLYAIAAFFHLFFAHVFLPVMPGWVPMPIPVILVTGVCEIAGAVGLLIPRTRYAAGIAFALYAICVFPVNIKHAMLGIEAGQIWFVLGYHIPRLLLQPVLVWLALFAGNVLDWPFTGHPGRRDNQSART